MLMLLLAYLVVLAALDLLHSGRALLHLATFVCTGDTKRSRTANSASSRWLSSRQWVRSAFTASTEIWSPL